MRHRGGALLVKLAIVGTTLVFGWRLLQEIGWAALLERMGSARPGLLLLACLALMARGVLLSLRWSLCLASLQRPISGVFLLTAQLAAILVNHVTPTARLLGGVMRARYLSRRYPVPLADALGSVLLDQISQQLVQGLLTWLALAGLAWGAGAIRTAWALVAAMMVLAVTAFLWRLNHPSLLDSPAARWLRHLSERGIRRLGSAGFRTARVAGLLRQGLTDPRLQLRLAGLSLIVVAVSAGSQWLVFRSLGYAVGYLPVIAVVTVGLAAGIVTGTPGGIATTEAAMIAGFVALGVPEVEASAATLLFRGLHYCVVLALGLPAFLYCETWGGRPSRWADSLVAGDVRDVETPASGSRPDRDG